MTAAKINPTLTIAVTYVPGTGRAKVATRISVRVGGSEVAHKTLGLRYTLEQAQREWRINRRTFTVTEPGILRLAA